MGLVTQQCINSLNVALGRYQQLTRDKDYSIEQSLKIGVALTTLYSEANEAGLNSPKCFIIITIKHINDKLWLEH
jgi:hypothetical protein